MKSNVSIEVKKIIQNALKEAKTFNDVKLKPEHILLAIINGDNQGITTIVELGINIDGLYETIIESLYNDIKPRVAVVDDVETPPNSDTKDLLKNAEQQCKALGDEIINANHLILSMLDLDLNVTKFLKDINMEYKTVKDKISNEFGGNLDYENENKANKKRSTSDSTTPVLDNFCRDITKLANAGATDPVVGRKKEIKRVSQILSRRKKNNPVLISEPGVGKCICSDTEVIIRNDLTGEVFKTTITNVLNTFTKPQSTFSKKICIEKYGEIEGLKIFTERQSKWTNSLNENGNLKSGYSKISQDLFNKLLVGYDNTENIKFATHNGEFKLNKETGGIWMYDFTDIKNKKIIEFHGDMFHGNPKKYLSDDRPHPFRKNITAKEMWGKDKIKRDLAISEGFVNCQ